LRRFERYTAECHCHRAARSTWRSHCSSPVRCRSWS
jgi:hypothetical protein